MTRLADFETHLAIFAEGISGQRYQIRDDETLANPFGHNPNRIPVFAHRILYLPREFNFFSSEEANRQAYLLLALLQLGHFEFGTFDFDMHKVRESFPSLQTSRSYLGDRESELGQLYRYFDNPVVARRLFCVIESERVERRLLAKYPGTKKYRDGFQSYVDSIHESNSSRPVDSVIRDLSGHLRGVPARKSPYLKLVLQAVSPQANVHDSISATVDCYNAIQHLLQDEELSSADAETSLQHLSLDVLQRQSKLDEWERELAGIDSEFAKVEMLDALVEASDVEEYSRALESFQADRELLAKRRARIERLAIVEKSSLGILAKRTADTSVSYRYDEWDYLNKVWLRNWCVLHEFVLPKDVTSETAELIQTVRPHVRSVRKLFEQLRPTGMKRAKHQADGDELDLDRTVDMRVDRKSRTSIDDRVYSRRAQTSRDIATLVLVDLSASTDSPITNSENALPQIRATDFKAQDLRDPYFDDDYLNGRLDFNPVHMQESASKRVIDVMREAVLLLATALESLNDTFAVYGFSGYGKDNVEFYVAKEFHRKLALPEIGAFTSLEPKRSTRMGPAIRHAINKLIGTGSAMKVLLIVSDGFPQDCDYGPDRTSHEYGVQDTAMALREAAYKRIQSFCVTVDHAGHDYLRKMCPRDRYLVIEDLESLPLELNRAYRRLVAR